MVKTLKFLFGVQKNTIKKILLSATFIAIILSAIILVSQSLNQQNKKIKILIVAGHEPNAGGADEFKAIKERDLNLQLSNILKDMLSTNPNLEIITARDSSGWNTDLKNYIETNSTTIMEWASAMKNKMMGKVDAGKIELIDPNMKHNNATTNAILYLFGTNKWIEKNNIDLVLHIHFNSNPKINGKPVFRGYCMYIPEKQYSNSTSSRIFANYLNTEISEIEKPSNMLQEKDLIIEDQQLIATGVYNTLKIPVVVVEYAYIYEPMMLSSSTRNIFIEKAASSTAIAINNYLSRNK